MGDDLGPWNPLTLDELADLLSAVDVPWWLAGGWAIDRLLGRQTRPHADVDVLVLRPHLERVRSAVQTWDLHAADPPGTLRPWEAGEILRHPVHDVWCRPTPGSPWQFQFMIDELDGADWVYRRDPEVRRPWTSLTASVSTAALPVLTPEVQLLYKSARPRPKDHADLRAVAPELSPTQVSWLRRAITRASPDHPWLTYLPPAPQP